MCAPFDDSDGFLHETMHASHSVAQQLFPLSMILLSLLPAEHPAVAQAMKQHIQQPAFGQELDAICAWFYDWCRSTSPLLQRFVARQAPELAKHYLLHALSTTETHPVPGLEVDTPGISDFLLQLLSAMLHRHVTCVHCSLESIRQPCLLPEIKGTDSSFPQDVDLPPAKCTTNGCQ